MTAQLDAAAPQWCVRLIAELNAADQRAIALAKTLTAEQLNWKRRPDEWSVGQCLEHLCVSNEVYLPPIASSLVGRQLGAVQEITPGWLGRWFIRNYIEPSSVTRRARAPKKIAPTMHVDPSVLDHFLRGNREARELVHRARSYDVNRLRFRNPFVPLLRFTVGTGFEIVSKHERRHLLQAERIKECVEFPGRDTASGA
ncbi:MAG: DinB family protein [Gemmatimonadaceae bacterium]